MREYQLNKTAHMETSEAQHSVQSIIEMMSSAIVEKKEAVVILITQKESSTHYLVHCDPADARFIIGKGGTNAQGIKAIARSAGRKLGIKVEVEFDIPEVGGSTTPGATGACGSAPVPTAPEPSTQPGGDTVGVPAESIQSPITRAEITPAQAA